MQVKLLMVVRLPAQAKPDQCSNCQAQVWRGRGKGDERIKVDQQAVDLDHANVLLLRHTETIEDAEARRSWHRLHWTCGKASGVVAAMTDPEVHSVKKRSRGMPGARKLGYAIGYAYYGLPAVIRSLGTRHRRSPFPRGAVLLNIVGTGLAMAQGIAAAESGRVVGAMIWSFAAGLVFMTALDCVLTWFGRSRQQPEKRDEKALEILVGLAKAQANLAAQRAGWPSLN